MKKSFLPLLIFGFLFLFTKPATAQNEQLIKEIRNHILKVDSLIACCRDSLSTLHRSMRSTGGGRGGSTTYWTGVNPLNSRTECHMERRREREEFERTLIFRQMRVDGIHCRTYFKDGEIIAVKRECRSLPNFETARLTIFISNNEIIYFQSEGCARVVQRNKEAIKQRHNLR